ncbi:hypothetical protein [Pseudomonas phage D6]|nr:hypothetical protein [Pseudomonas phage D6]
MWVVVLINGYVAGVGSRTVPEWALELMIRLGRTYTDLGYQMSSGDAWDSDRAFLYGAAQSKRYQEIGARVYLHKDGANGRWVKDNPFYYDASLFDSTTTATALSMAAIARGGFYGLSPGGVLLHTRNVYQIHGADLVSLVSAMYYYAKPKGTTKCEGGTNTALQLAKEANVPIIKNLYEASVVEEIEAWLTEHELDYPYIDIDWHQIHKPDDPRLKEFEA